MEIRGINGKTRIFDAKLLKLWMKDEAPVFLQDTMVAPVQPANPAPGTPDDPAVELETSEETLRVVLMRNSELPADQPPTW